MRKERRRRSTGTTWSSEAEPQRIRTKLTTYVEFACWDQSTTARPLWETHAADE